MKGCLWMILAVSLMVPAPAYAGDAMPLTVSNDPLSNDIVPNDELMVADAAPLSADQMDQARGGFADPSGLIYRFSVDVQTALNGSEVFTRSLTVMPGINGQFQATTSANVIGANIPAGLNVAMIGNGSGVRVTDAAGNVTTVFNQTAAGVPSSIILNNANNRTISQTVNLNLVLPNLSTIMNFVHASLPSAAMAQQNAVRGLGF
jgi:hypothetical protein